MIQKRRSPQRVEKMISAARATQAIEGIHLTSDEEELIRKNLIGEMSDQEFAKLVLERIRGK